MSQAALDSVSLRVQAEQIANAYFPNTLGPESPLGDIDLVQRLLACLAEGNYRETACRVAGISKGSFYNWLKRADAGDEAAILFVNAVEKAEALAESETVRNVRNASKLPQFWAAGMTWLERKSPDKWGRRQDDASVPKVIVQVGGSANDVRVLVQGSETPLSPVPFASEEGRRSDANPLSTGTYDVPSCPITAVMVTTQGTVPGVTDQVTQPDGGARFAGPAGREQGPPLRAGGLPGKARRRGPAAKDVRARRRAGKEKRSA